MCGIAGEYRFDPESPVAGSLAERMAAILRHRGPDGRGHHLGPRGSSLLVSTRLAIVDLDHGGQPMSNEDGSVWVVFNGELYGFAEIARDLERRGHRIRTACDTEVLVHLYEEYGDAFVEHLRGEFAIALLDQARDRLLLVRDRFGIKPLYYLELPEAVVFGSEIKAIFCHPAARPRLNRANVYHLLHGLMMPGETYFEGVRQVEPGTMVEVTRSGVARRRYWRLPFEPAAGSRAMDEGEAVEEFRRLFREAVRLRLHGDVEVATYLSGGIDSSAVTAVAAELSPHPLKAFTVAFRDPDYDEGAAATRFCAERGLEHHVVRVGPGDLAEHFERSLWHSEIPVVNSHGTAKMLLSGLAGRHVKVVLTGEGADEALAGYSSFRHLALLDARRRHPSDREIRRRLDRFLADERLLTGIVRVRDLLDYDRVIGLFGAYPYSIVRALIIGRSLSRFLSRDFKREMAGIDPLAEMAERLGRGSLTGLDPIAASQAYLFNTELPCYILNYLGDRVEMANSIEGRVPFLDHRLVEFACTLPTELKLRDDTGKHVLRRAFADSTPAASKVAKKVFLAPSAESLGLASGGELQRRYLSLGAIGAAGIFNPLMLAALRQSLRFMSRGANNYALAEGLLTTAASVHALEGMFSATDPTRTGVPFRRPLL